MEEKTRRASSDGEEHGEFVENDERARLDGSDKQAERRVTAGRTGASVKRSRPVHLPEFELTEQIIGAAITVRKELGRFYGETVYRNAIMIALEERGIGSAREVPFRVHYRGRQVGYFRADLVVEGRVLVELKAGRPLEPAHEAQLLGYLAASGIHVGLLIHIDDTVTVRRMVR